MQREIGSSPMAVIGTLQKMAQQPAWKEQKKELTKLVKAAAATNKFIRSFDFLTKQKQSPDRTA
ncbi:MAG: hypothetical protein KA314_28545 [Chloroflexi bacterium]|nr:hypothetical protein [Chloroflexota bacterium]